MLRPGFRKGPFQFGPDLAGLAQALYFLEQGASLGEIGPQVDQPLFDRVARVMGVIVGQVQLEESA